MDLIRHYYPGLTSRQLKAFEQLSPLYTDWNEKINVISRKDIPNLYEHHVLHSLAIARFIQFTPGSRVLDIGSGGGFPGIPLAILFPDTQFDLLDSVGKKLMVVDAISASLGLDNVKTCHIRAEKHSGKYDFVVARAVDSIKKMVYWTNNLVGHKQRNEKKNGWLLLKGGDLDAEIAEVKGRVKRYPLSKWFQQEWFEHKELLYYPKRQVNRTR